MIHVILALVFLTKLFFDCFRNNRFEILINVVKTIIFIYFYFIYILRHRREEGAENTLSVIA